MNVLKLKKTTWLWIAAGAAVLAALVWAFSPRPVEVETATVKQDHFEQSIEEDGRTRLKDRYTVSAPVAARVARMVLREGDSVAAGDVVAVLTPVMSSMVDERSAREATARLKAAAAGVERASARVARARISLQEAQLEKERTEKLAGEGFLSASRLDAVRLAQSGARRELEVADAEREMAVQEKAQAAAALQPAAAGSSSTRPLSVRSPVSGVVLRVPQPSEANIAAGAALLDIGDPLQMEVISELLTTDAMQATAGRRVVIERWGGPPVEGLVRRVEPAAFTKVSALGVEEQRVNVLIDVSNPPEAWRSMGDGFRVSVRIVTASIEQAVLAPLGALFPHGKGMAAYRLDGRHARLQPVEVGARNNNEAWLRSGLTEGQTVIVYPPATIRDGSKVHVRTP
ncbi:efflux RND transporter periplasmic adaptor subunit [Polaromonas sp. AER18D-145]|uniref:efflux RND transporter periplasmic adaptor subunit n=1 Tax=Polaromonas sp. AER18D-145 TaxID=1977060 RepID=UPI000BBC6B5D|nr:HlyD family efflux transporter periplasmic adaptor subunit [Polaromonas sp. AER18D-145]